MKEFKPRLRPLQLSDDGSTVRLSIAKGDREHVFLLEYAQAASLRDELISVLSHALARSFAARTAGKALSKPAPVIQATGGGIATRIAAPGSETWCLAFHDSKGEAASVLMDGKYARRMARAILGMDTHAPPPAQNDE